MGCKSFSTDLGLFLFIACAIIFPTEESEFAEIVPTCSIDLLSIHGFDKFFKNIKPYKLFMKNTINNYNNKYCDTIGFRGLQNMLLYKLII